MPATQSIELHSTVVVAKDQISSELGEEAVVLDLHGGKYHGLNPTAARIWALLAQPRKVSEIRNTLLREYDVDPVRCQADLLQHLATLASKGLIEVR